MQGKNILDFIGCTAVNFLVELTVFTDEGSPGLVFTLTAVYSGIHH
jgi:hypothetical protein